MLDSAASLWGRLAKIGPSRMSMGFPRWEYLVEPTPHQYVLLAGRPGTYKSMLAWSWATNLAFSGKKVLWLGMDMDHTVQPLWAFSRMTQIPVRRLVAFGRQQILLSSSETSALLIAEERFNTLPLVLWSEDSITDTQMEEAILRVPYDAVFLDYVQLVQVPGVDSEYDRVNIVSERLRKIKKAHRRHLVVLSQMNRAIEHTQGRPRPPCLADLRGSGQLEADAEIVAFSWKPEAGPGAPKDERQLRIEKNRHGPVGIVNLRVKPETAEVEEIPEGSQADAPGEGETDVA